MTVRDAGQRSAIPIPAARFGLASHGARLPTGPILIALRGWRRALGTLVLEGAHPDEPSDRLDLAGDLGRQLSDGIENVQLLEEMLRQRRLLEDTFNSLLDLVVVTDRQHRVVQMNDAFAMRLGRARAEPWSARSPSLGPTCRGAAPRDLPPSVCARASGPRRTFVVT
jgi:PAS domain-containing protein